MATQHLPGEPEAVRAPSSQNLQSIGFILISVLLGACGQLTFKAALNQIGELSFSIEMLVTLATNPILLLGLGMFGVSALLWLLALLRADLSFAYPFLSLSYIIVMVGGALLFQEPISITRIIGIGIIIGGLLVIAQGEQANKAQAADGASQD